MASKKKLHRKIGKTQEHIALLETKEEQQASTIGNLELALENEREEKMDLRMEIRGRDITISEHQAKIWILEREIEYLRNLAVKERSCPKIFSASALNR